LVPKLSVKGTPKLWPKQVGLRGGKGSLHGKSGSRMRAAELESAEAGLVTVAMGLGWKVGVKLSTGKGFGAKRKRLLSRVLKDGSTQSPNRGGSISGAGGRCGVILDER
jgi:hypothetical protein